MARLNSLAKRADTFAVNYAVSLNLKGTFSACVGQLYNLGKSVKALTD